MLHAVIMAGGSGTRFWPESRQAFPKQFLRLAGTPRTMIQGTFDRVQGLIAPENVWVVTNHLQAGKTREQLPEIPQGQILIEPAARNTAPCIGLAALCLAAKDPEAVMLVMPADHIISPDGLFQQAVRNGVELVRANPQRLVLFGILPQSPATGYGYIERGDSLPASPATFEVASFREKPNRETATEYVAAGRFYWNAGIFVWRASRILEALTEQQPEMAQGLQRLSSSLGTPSFNARLAEIFPKLKSISIDYAVLEKDHGICVVEAPFQWDDVGSWEALPRLQQIDDKGNTLDGLQVLVDTEHCIIRNHTNHIIAGIGLRDLVIVHTPDATLIARRDDETGLRELIQQLRETGHDGVL